MTEIREFRIAVPQADLDYLRDLAGYWRAGFDWRAHEARLNAFPQFTTEVDGLDVHFLHVRGDDADALPLLLVAPEVTKAAPEHVVGVFVNGGLGFPTEADLPSLSEEEREFYWRMQGWAGAGVDHHALLRAKPGGHFVALEVPEVFAGEVRASLGKMR